MECAAGDGVDRESGDWGNAGRKDRKGKRMNRKNKMVTVLAALLLVTSLIGGGIGLLNSEPVSAAEVQRVFDQADLFSDREEGNLQESVIDLAGDIQMDVAIATVADTNFMQTYEYAESFYMEQGIGYGENRVGFLFLIDMDNRQVYIDEYNASEEGFALSTAERDSILDRVMDYMYDGDYYGASVRFVKELPKYVGNGTSGDADYWDAIENGEPDVAPTQTRPSLQYRILQSLPMSAFVALVIGVIAVVILVLQQKTGSKASAVDYQKGGIQMIRKIDRFQNTTVTKTKIETQTRSGGGGGGGSSHHGGGHSGGGRSF